MDSPCAPPLRQQLAAGNLRFIRETMARVIDFTAVPGVGGVATGFGALDIGFGIAIARNYGG